MGTKGINSVGLGDNWARGNYAANGAAGRLSTSLTYSAGGRDTPAWNDADARGVMGVNVGLALRQITDGTSHTFLLAEIRAGITPYDTRGIWAMSGACPSSLWTHCGFFAGDVAGPNSSHFAADDMLNCSQLSAAFGDPTHLQTKGNPLAALGMPCSRTDYPDIQQGARSMHRGGVQIALADGSVHWIGDYIQILPSRRGALSVWDRLIASGDGSNISANAF
jgi:hypothetical protein